MLPFLVDLQEMAGYRRCTTLPASGIVRVLLFPSEIGVVEDEVRVLLSKRFSVCNNLQIARQVWGGRRQQLHLVARLHCADLCRQLLFDKVLARH